METQSYTTCRDATDATATNEDGESAWDLIQENDALEGSPAYWALNDLRSQ